MFVPTETGGWSAVVADARTGAVVRRIPIPEGTGGLRYGFGSLWAALGPDQLVRLDPATGDVRQQYDVGLSPVFVSVGTDRVWVMNQASGSVSAVDPRSGEVTEVVVDTGVIEGGDIVATPEAVWVRVTDVLAARVDPAWWAQLEKLAWFGTCFTPGPGLAGACIFEWNQLPASWLRSTRRCSSCKVRVHRCASLDEAAAHAAAGRRVAIDGPLE